MLYIAGDAEEITNLFTRIEKFMRRISGDANILEFKDYKKETMNGMVKKDGRKHLSPNRKSFKGSVDIMEMDENKNPSETESTLEFVLLTLCRALNLKATQSVALLANNNEYLMISAL